MKLYYFIQILLKMKHPFKDNINFLDFIYFNLFLKRKLFIIVEYIGSINNLESSKELLTMETTTTSKSQGASITATCVKGLPKSNSEFAPQTKPYILQSKTCIPQTCTGNYYYLNLI
jgi:hypothetical protein